MSTFISYSRADASFAVRIAKDLKAAGYDVWLDQLDIPTGARWDDEIETVLEACTTFMIILSPDSIQSQNVKDEVGYAIDAGKDILPVRIKSGDIPFRLRRFQYVDFTSRPYEASLKEIKSLLSTTGHVLTPKGAEPETRPSMRPPVAVTQKVPAPGPKATGSPPLKKPASRGLTIGLVAVAALVLAGVAIRALLGLESPSATEPAVAPITESLPTEQPTATPTVHASQTSSQTQTGAFTTNFLEGTDLNDWEHFVLGDGRKSKVNVAPSNEGLMFHLEDPDLRAYYLYKPVVYEDVIIGMQVENLGQNTNHVSLVCRRTENTWYEFRIRAAALWRLFEYNGEYASLDNGGTFAGKPGKAINEYEMRCIGNEISLHINGEDVAAYTVARDVYPQGQVGFNVAADEVFPIDIRVIEFEVTTPPAAAAGSP